MGPASFRERGECESSGSELTFCDAETVSEVVATPPLGVTVAGAKVHVTPEGRPEQLKVVADANPFCGVTEILAVPDCPRAMVRELGETVTEKVTGGKLMVYAAEATGLVE